MRIPRISTTRNPGHTKVSGHAGAVHLAVGLSVSTDALVFNEDERGPADDQLRLHLEALNQLDDDEKATVINLIESVLLRHQARRLARTSG